jgi:hypothetical protein
MKKKKSIPEMVKKVSIRYNKDLDKYDNQVLFPEKVARANEMLKHAKFPPELSFLKKD